MRLKLGLETEDRLHHSRDFKEIYARGCKLNGPHLILFWLPNRSKRSRLGISVTKKRFKLSTERHRVQRWLREAYRLNKSRLVSGYDIVICARGFNKAKMRFAQINRELAGLLVKAQLFENK